MFTTLKSHLSAVGEIEPIDIALIRPSPLRLRESLGDIGSLLRSIEQHGLLQPIIVRIKGRTFEIVAGHRRFEAFRQLKKKHVPSIVIDADDKSAYEMALVENLQRGTLNPVEEAQAFKRYVDRHGWGGVTDLSRKIGMSEEYVSHRMRLLTLPEEVLAMISSRELNYSTARELVWVKDPKHQTLLAHEAITEKLSSRQIRRIAQNVGIPGEYLETSKGKTLDNDAMVIRKAIVVLKVAMMRLDSLSENQVSQDLHSKLMMARLHVHGLIGEFAKIKKDSTLLAISR